MAGDFYKRDGLGRTARRASTGALGAALYLGLGTAAAFLAWWHHEGEWTAFGVGLVSAWLATRHTSKQWIEQLQENWQKAPPPPRDDLQKIRGVGPALEKKLNEMGIHTFAQIAAWTDREIDAFEAKLPIVQRRVRRDEWVARAKELARLD